MAALSAPAREAAVAATEPVRTGLGIDAIKRDFLDNLFYIQARFPEVASDHDYYQALAYTVRDRLLERWVRSAQTFKSTAARTVCYFSAEFLLGPHLGANLLNLGIGGEVRRAMESLGLDLDRLIDHEGEPGLGNGGLGRLAACYMESLATLQIPAIGYGIRYEFGIFDQEIRDGWQVERSDKWLRYGNPWEIARPTITFNVKLGGHTEAFTDEQGRYRVHWIPQREVRGVAYDTPILGYRVDTANLLRLWTSEAVESFDFAAFNVGDYYGAVDEKILSETISKVLYPNDEPAAGKALRLAQQYFFVSCSLRDMIRIHLQVPGKDVHSLHEKYAVQLNDTHPSIAVAELMRLLVDEHLLGWDEAWAIVQRTFGYTNHTLLPEALETWPLPLFASLLPRHLEIIYEINRRFLDEVRLRYPGDEARVARLSLIDEHGEKHVRMANQRRGGAAYRVAQVERAARFLRARAGALQQQDEWCDAAAIRAACESWSGRPAQRAYRQRLDHAPGNAATAGAARAEPGVRQALARGKAIQQGTTRGLGSSGDRRRARPRLALRHSG
jgi:starch phosphorylase